ncbi:Protein DMR6-LIKE OXYGENASE 1 [Glycine soja]
MALQPSIFQMISNDKYKSVLHRALVNCKKERVSIPSYDTTRMSGTGDFPNKLASISSRPNTAIRPGFHCEASGHSSISKAFMAPVTLASSKTLAKLAKVMDFFRYVNLMTYYTMMNREDVAEYSMKMRELALKLVEAISESLGEKAVGKHGQHMAMNYYPPCPEPELRRHHHTPSR